MPGMMDTVLNLGLNDTIVLGLASKRGERFAYDCYRCVCGGGPGQQIEGCFHTTATARGAGGGQEGAWMRQMYTTKCMRQPFTHLPGS